MIAKPIQTQSHIMHRQHTLKCFVKGVKLIINFNHFPMWGKTSSTTLEVNVQTQPQTVVLTVGALLKVFIHTSSNLACVVSGEHFPGKWLMERQGNHKMVIKANSPQLTLR